MEVLSRVVVQPGQQSDPYNNVRMGDLVVHNAPAIFEKQLHYITIIYLRLFSIVNLT